MRARVEGRREATTIAAVIPGGNLRFIKDAYPSAERSSFSFSSQRVNMSKLCDIEVRQRYLGRINSNCLWVHEIKTEIRNELCPR